MNKITLLITALFTCGLALSQSFDFEGLSYDINPDGTTVTVTGRATGNTATEIVIPDTASDGTTTYNVIVVGSNAFSSSQLTSVTIGRNVTNIEFAAFGFAPITAPAKHSVLFLGEIPPMINLFSFFPNRSDIIITVGCGIFAPVYENAEGYDGFHEIRNSFLTDDGVRYCLNGEGAAVMRADEGIDISDPNSAVVMVMYPDGTSNNANGTDTTFGTDIVIPDTVHDGFKDQDVIDILPAAFLQFTPCFTNCTRLTSVVIGTNVKKIGKNAFFDNELTSVTIPNTVNTIGPAAFNFNQLTIVTIGNSITTIESRTFGFASATTSGTGEHSVTFLGTTPPSIETDSFVEPIINNTQPNRPDITLTVPCDALMTYENDTDYNDFYAIICPGIMTTWDGSMWSPDPPGPFDTIILAGDYDTAADGSLDVGSIEIQENAILTIADNTYVQTQGDITVNENGTINVANAGSIVQIDDAAVTINNGSIAVAKTTPIIDDRNFVAMSSPVTAEARDRVYGNSRAVFSIIPSNFVPFAIDFVEFPEFEFAENFLDDNNDYLLPVTGSTALPVAGIGQLIFPQPEPNVGDGAYTLTYTQNPMNPGTLNSGTISVPINYNGPATTNNYNLLGNPYASAIDVTAFITANDAVNEVYYWDHITNPSSDLPGFGTSNFSMNDISIRNAMMGIAAVNGGTAPGQFMASGQGFAIKADQAEMAAGTPVVFTNSIRVTGNNDGFRSSETVNNLDKLWLNLTTTAFDEAISQTGIGFIPDATAGFDSGYDSARLGTFISLFTTLETGEQLAIQGREAFDADMEIALGFSTTIEENASYTIDLNKLEGIHLEETPIFLIDHLLGTTTNLKEASYSFTSERGIQSDRFTLIFKERDVLGVDEESFRESKINLYPNPSEGQITLTYSGTATLENAVITDVNGKIIKRIDLQNFNQSQTIALDDLARGMYFMQITSQENTVIKKLILR